MPWWYWLLAPGLLLLAPIAHLGLWASLRQQRALLWLSDILAAAYFAGVATLILVLSGTQLQLLGALP